MRLCEFFFFFGVGVVGPFGFLFFEGGVERMRMRMRLTCDDS